MKTVIVNFRPDIGSRGRVQKLSVCNCSDISQTIYDYNPHWSLPIGSNVNDLWPFSGTQGQHICQTGFFSISRTTNFITATSAKWPICCKLMPILKKPKSEMMPLSKIMISEYSDRMNYRQQRINVIFLTCHTKFAIETSRCFMLSLYFSVRRTSVSGCWYA